MFFDGFELTSVQLRQGRVRLRIGGSGPPLLLLHGALQTHAMWNAVAPRLARDHFVICPDLRGHGGSFRPVPTADHAAHGAQAMAEDMLALMDALGVEAFSVAGHDRGADVAHRLALAAPLLVRHLTVLDAVPDAPRAEHDMAAELGGFPGLWFFEPRPLAEQVVSLAPEAWFNDHQGGVPSAPEWMRRQALAEYLAAADDPAAMAAMKESFRAAATIDRLQAAVARAEGRRIACETLVLWGTHGHLGGWYDPRAAWQAVCDAPVSGQALEAGHYLAEEVPDRVAMLMASADQAAAAA
jgi:haloacetate dehalogenase